MRRVIGEIERTFPPQGRGSGIQQLAFRRADQPVELGLTWRLQLEAALADLDQI
jgi:hypothetical protein